MTVPFRTFVIIMAAVSALVSGCAPPPPLLPPGEVPRQEYLSQEDEEYGQEVLGTLLQQYRLDTNDANVNRVRDIVDRLTKAAGSDRNPWHVHVLLDDKFKNAAATRGNYVFVWTGMLNATQSDAELATILAHEVGHVLAGHTAKNPEEEANRMMSDAAGQIAQQVLSQQPGAAGLLAGVAGMIISEVAKGMLVNPNTQRQEFEADQVGIFLMADAEYDPRSGIEFWRRAASDPDFQAGTLEFLSSHPGTDARLQRLESLLPDAEQRYRDAKNGVIRRSTSGGSSSSPRPRHPGPRRDGSGKSRDSAPPPASSREGEPASKAPPWVREVPWEIRAAQAPIYADPDTRSRKIGELPRGQSIDVLEFGKRWVELRRPVGGFVQARDIQPSIPEKKSKDSRLPSDSNP